MSFLSSIFPPSSGTPANGAGAAPGAAPAAAPAVAAVTTPAVAATVVEPAAPASPLDEFTKLWQPVTGADGKPIAPAGNTLAEPVFNFDPAKVRESAAKMDFAAGIPPEMMTKALAGDAASMAAAINHAVQQAVVGMTLNTGNLINQAVVANNDRVTASLPTHIKRVQLQDIPNDNPVLSHPAVQPLVETLKRAAFEKDPRANPAEVAASINSYLMGLGVALADTTPAAVAAKAKVTAGEQDWSSFLP